MNIHNNGQKTLIYMTKPVILSHTLEISSPVYPGMRPISIMPIKSISKGDSSNSWYISMGNHVGTHVDSQRHFYQDGKSISEHGVEDFVLSKAVIIDVPKRPSELILRSDLEKYQNEISEASMIMIRTGVQTFRTNDPDIYINKGPCLSSSAARYLSDFYPNLRALGIDSISISSPEHREEGREAHKILLKNPRFLIVEDMNLESKPRFYSMVIIAPLLIRDIDSSPCTVIGFAD